MKKKNNTTFNICTYIKGKEGEFLRFLSFLVHFMKMVALVFINSLFLVVCEKN